MAEPAGGLPQTPLGGSCSPWSLSTALGTWAACECVRAGGMEDAVAMKGVFYVEKVRAVHCVGGEVMGQVVYRWVAWLLFKGCAELKGTAGSGQLCR